MLSANTLVVLSNASSLALSTAALASPTKSPVPASIFFASLPLISPGTKAAGAATPLKTPTVVASPTLKSFLRSAAISVFCAAMFCNEPATPSTPIVVVIGRAAACLARVVRGFLNALSRICFVDSLAACVAAKPAPLPIPGRARPTYVDGAEASPAA